jgi:alpha-L-rhamnosidase
MDCPSRERAGWLCDSFFTARAEHSLTGKSLVERAFLANFLLPDEIPYTPEGMLPCCYPAEMNRVHFIPNWAMWFVLELEEYLERTGDHAFVIAAKPKMMQLLNYFRRFENEYGLLESLESWIFVEWSQANKLVRDVNFPTNMLFSRTKRALAKLYDMPELAAEADIMDKNIIDLSLDGLFFCDNALRQDGKLVLSGEHTEVCQYYAFFCGTVTPDSHPELWKTMVEDFGPQRTSAYPEVHSANTFIGHYLRLDIFARYGLKENVLENIVGYFYYMAEKVGTLWENKTPHASCCHGFTSCVIYWLDKFGMLE